MNMSKVRNPDTHGKEIILLHENFFLLYLTPDPGLWEQGFSFHRQLHPVNTAAIGRCGVKSVNDTKQNL